MFFYSESMLWASKHALGIYSHWNSDLEILMPPPLKIKVIILTFQIRVLSSKR